MQACIAYCYITIPMIDDITKQLRLYLMSAEGSLEQRYDDFLYTILKFHKRTPNTNTKKPTTNLKLKLRSSIIWYRSLRPSSKARSQCWAKLQKPSQKALPTSSWRRPWRIWLVLWSSSQMTPKTTTCTYSAACPQSWTSLNGKRAVLSVTLFY